MHHWRILFSTLEIQMRRRRLSTDAFWSSLVNMVPTRLLVLRLLPPSDRTSTMTVWRILIINLLLHRVAALLLRLVGIFVEEFRQRHRSVGVKPLSADGYTSCVSSLVRLGCVFSLVVSMLSYLRRFSRAFASYVHVLIIFSLLS